MPLNFATKAFSYNLAKFWANFCGKLYNILLSRMRISQNLFFFCGFISNFFLASFAFLFLSLSFLLSSTLYPLSIHWKSFGLSPSKNLEMEHWSTRWLGLFYHQLCTQNWTRFFWYSSARIWSIFKMDTLMDGSVLAVLAAYQNNLVTSKMMTSQVAQWFPTSTSGKYNSWRERVKSLTQTSSLNPRIWNLVHKKNSTRPLEHRATKKALLAEYFHCRTLNKCSQKEGFIWKAFDTKLPRHDTN